MAIVIEQEKRRMNWFVIGVIAVIVLILALAVYYLFFISPIFIEVVLPLPLKELESISRITLNPAEIFNQSVLKNLQLYVQPIIPEPALNPNPFK